jgi:hypothetical protein
MADFAFILSSILYLEASVKFWIANNFFKCFNFEIEDQITKNSYEKFQMSFIYKPIKKYISLFVEEKIHCSYVNL